MGGVGSRAGTKKAPRIFGMFLSRGHLRNTKEFLGSQCPVHARRTGLGDAPRPREYRWCPRCFKGSHTIPGTVRSVPCRPVKLKAVACVGTAQQHHAHVCLTTATRDSLRIPINRSLTLRTSMAWGFPRTRVVTSPSAFKVHSIVSALIDGVSVRAQ